MSGWLSNEIMFRWSCEKLETTMVCHHRWLSILFRIKLSMEFEIMKINVFDEICFQEVDSPRGVIPLVDVGIREIDDDRTKQFCLELFPLTGDKVKASKPAPGEIGKWIDGLFSESFSRVKT